mgnify:CR=1 FL=1
MINYTNSKQYNKNKAEILKSKLIKNILTYSIIFALLSVVISNFIIVPEYTSSVTMMISKTEYEDNKKSSNKMYYEILANKSLISTYSEILKSRGILNQVINNLELDMNYTSLADKIYIRPIKGTQIISITVLDTNPMRAKDIANETANIFKSSIAEIIKVDNVNILDGAIIANNPIYPNIGRAISFWLYIGAIVGLFVTYYQNSDKIIKSSDDVKYYFDIPTLGSIPDKNHLNIL